MRQGGIKASGSITFDKFETGVAKDQKRLDVVNIWHVAIPGQFHDSLSPACSASQLPYEKFHENIYGKGTAAPVERITQEPRLSFKLLFRRRGGGAAVWCCRLEEGRTSSLLQWLKFVVHGF